MFNVLFIDDDTFMLRALLRLAKRLRPGWTFWTEEDAANWPRSVPAHVKLDLVICDYLMPRINGDKVLVEVAQLQPGAIRALLTGDTTEDVICSVSKSAHFVLSKPFNERDILQLFQCVELVHSLPVSDNVREMLGSSALLMPLPAVVKQVREVLSDDTSEPGDIVDIVQHDPLITAKILQLANSAFMGFSRATLSLDEAVKRLGIKLTAAIITSLAMEQASESMLDHDVHKQISHAAYSVAGHGRQLCTLLDCNQDVADELFAAALLSAIGPLITSTRLWQQEYAVTYAKWPVSKLQSVVSAFMLTLWGYSESLVQAVLKSPSPDFYYADANLALLLYLARQRAANNGRVPEFVLDALSDEVIRKKLTN